MFCDGKCKDEIETADGTLVKKCGLWRSLVTKDKQTQEITEYDMCIFDALMNSLHRLEDIGVVKASTIQEQRNETTRQSVMVSKTIADGFLGLIYTMEDDKQREALIRSLKSVKLIPVPEKQEASK